MVEYIGFIGVGMMGTPMTKRLINAGYKVVAFDTDPEAMERAKENGAQTVASPREVAERCNPVITMLPNSDIVEKVVLGSWGQNKGL